MQAEKVQQERIYDDEIDLVQLIRSVWRFKWLLVGLVVFAVLVSVLYSKFLITPLYASDAMLQSKSAESLTHIINSTTFKENLIIELSANAEKDNVILAARNLQATSRGDLIDLATKSPNPEGAYLVLRTTISNVERLHEQLSSEEEELKQQYLENIREQIEITERVMTQTKEQIEALLSHTSTTPETDILLSQLVVNLSQQVQLWERLSNQELRTSQELINFSVITINDPYLPERPEGIGLVRNMAIAAVLALMLGLFIVFVKVMFEDYDNRSKEV